MKQGFKDACSALCQGQGQDPVPKIAQACRAAAIELPTGASTGYRQGFDKTVTDMYNFFQVGEEVRPAEVVPVPPVYTRVIVNKVPITLDETVLDNGDLLLTPVNQHVYVK
jgi:hypothetical protein